MKLSLNERVFDLEKQIVLNSGLWDAEYYIKTYHPEMRKYEALEYYCQKGYKHLENPSKIFDAKKYKQKYKNPIIDFVTKGRYGLHQLFFKNEFVAPQEVVDSYLLEYKNRGKSNKVVYMCIINDYDDIHELEAFYYTDNSWDYVCFTDNKEWINQKRIGIWEIRPIVYNKMDSARNNRWHKLHPHLLFEDYEESVYIDSNINILTPKFFDVINNTDKDILLPIHSNGIDLYKELLHVRNLGLDLPEVIDEQYRIIKEAGFPENYGMFENNIVYRKHHSAEIIDLMNDWWYFVENYCRRDQTSLAYLFWKRNRKIRDYAFENTKIDYRNYCVFAHKKKWERCEY
jgi:hypothetical protein